VVALAQTTLAAMRLRVLPTVAAVGAVAAATLQAAATAAAV